jgi:UDP-glucuronate 4-epimerase
VRILVTGVAGFIGSHLAESLLSDGHEVIGVDSLLPTYDSRQRLANVSGLDDLDLFTMHIDDLRTVDLANLVEGADVVYHLAAIPGVRASWTSFPAYLEHNVLVLQRLLDAARHVPVGRIVWASSSSVYGETDHYPTGEADATQPHSPYGATKLAGEHLAGAYARNYGVDVVGLRYFSVYGPRQRPDMGVHRICEAALGRGIFPLYGDGEQLRDMTYVGDVVRATRAATSPEVAPGTFLNVAGGCMVSVNELINEIERIGGQRVAVEKVEFQAGDVRRTEGDTTAIRELIGWRPLTGLREGLEAQFRWHRDKSPRIWPTLSS